MESLFAGVCSQSYIGRLDPRCRLIAACVLSIICALLQSTQAAAVALIFSWILISLTRPPVAALFKRWLAVNVFILFMWFTTPWAVQGQPIYADSWITKEGIALCLLITIKANALFFIFVSLISTLSFSQLAHAMESLYFPKKLVMVVLFTARGIRIFTDEYQRLRQAVKLRGFEPKTDLRTYQTFAAVISLLFFHAFRRSMVLQDAMKLRGFNGSIRTIETYQWKNADSLFLLFCGLFCVVLLTVLLRCP